MNNAQNGARIKVFGGSPYPNSTSGGGTGYVRVRSSLPLSGCHAHRFAFRASPSRTLTSIMSTTPSTWIRFVVPKLPERP